MVTHPDPGDGQGTPRATGVRFGLFQERLETDRNELPQTGERPIKEVESAR